MKYALIGFTRAIGVVVLTSALAYIGQADHLSFLSPSIAVLISAVALAIEHSIENRTGNALFGAVKA